MKARISFVLVMLGVLLLTSSAAGASPQVYPELAVDPFPVRINEIAPRPAPGGHDWVELHRARAPFVHYLAVLPKGAAAAVAGVSRAEPLADPDISGWQISDQDGHNYTIPAALPPAPVGAFIVVHFDGLGPGADDYSFADGVAHLHTPAGLADIFDDGADQVALYTDSTHNASTIRDFVAYGGPPGGDADDAVAAGLWSADTYIGPTAQAPGNDVLGVGGSAGVYPGYGPIRSTIGPSTAHHKPRPARPIQPRRPTSATRPTASSPPIIRSRLAGPTWPARSATGWRWTTTRASDRRCWPRMCR